MNSSVAGGYSSILYVQYTLGFREARWFLRITLLHRVLRPLRTVTLLDPLNVLTKLYEDLRPSEMTSAVSLPSEARSSGKEEFEPFLNDGSSNDSPSQVRGYRHGHDA